MKWYFCVKRKASPEPFDEYLEGFCEGAPMWNTRGECLKFYDAASAWKALADVLDYGTYAGGAFADTELKVVRVSVKPRAKRPRGAPGPGLVRRLAVKGY